MLELLVVLLIVALSAALVGPRIADSLNTLHLRTAAKSIAAAMRYARSQAVTERVMHRAVFDFDANRFSLTRPEEESETADVPEAENSGAVVVKTYNLPKGVTFWKGLARDGETEVDSGLFEVIFYAGGGSSGGEIVLVNERERRYEIHADFITGSVSLREAKD